jgi:carboxymethylenebutenolidase
MSEKVTLKASDGHELGAYVARPSGTPIAGLVVIQEAFGVNSHIRSVADGYARDGFLAVAPALFDRIERGVELGYTGEDWQKGITLAQQTNDNAVTDMDAALTWLRDQNVSKSGVIGYCLGGTMAWLAATRLNIGAAVGYYGGHISRFAQETPRCPVMLHFGQLDKHIPKEDIDKLQALHPEVQVFWYQNADHGFNCNDRASHNPEAAKLARERSLAFLKQHLSS